MIQITDRRTFFSRAVAWAGCCLAGTVLGRKALPETQPFNVPAGPPGPKLVCLRARYSDGTEQWWNFVEGTVSADLEAEAIEKTKPGDKCRTYKQGRKFLTFSGELT